MAVDFTPIVKALAEYGASLDGAHKTELEAMLEPLADTDANAIVTGIADHIDLHGMSGVLETPLRNALIEAEPTIDATIDANISGGFDALQSWLNSVAGVA